MRTRFSIIILAAALAGCAVPPPTPEMGTVRTDLSRLKQEQEALTEQVRKLQDNMVLIEARAQDQRQLIEEMRETLAAQKVTPAGEKAEPATTQAAPGAQAGQSLSPTEIYLQAFSDYTSGRFRQGIAGFESFLNRYPGSDYAGNAQYWLGECYYSLQQYDRAAQEFARVVENYPQGSKAPEALLKMASALLRMDQGEQAAKALQILRQKYPDSPAAKKALRSEEFSNILQYRGM